MGLVVEGARAARGLLMVLSRERAKTCGNDLGELIRCPTASSLETESGGGAAADAGRHLWWGRVQLLSDDSPFESMTGVLDCLQSLPACGRALD